MTMPPVFAGECLRSETVSYLRANAIDIVSIVDITPSATDVVVLLEALQRQRVLITADYDFGDLSFRDRKPALGIVVVALNRLRTTLHGPIVLAALLTHALELVGGFLNVEPGRTRMRRLTGSR